MTTTRLLLFMVIAIGCARIAMTYGVYTQTVDEAAHLGAGMQWWQEGKYTFEPLHPPLARIAIAALPFAAGVRFLGVKDNMWRIGNSVLHANGQYWRNLTLARLGVLPFFILACWLVWTWARKSFGNDVALISVLLFTNIPGVLAHAGLATTDLPVTALIMASLVSLSLWLQSPTWRQSFALGAAIGAAIVTKFSAIPFLLVGAGILVLSQGQARLVGLGTRRILALLIVFVSMFLSIWAIYRFSVGSLTTFASRPHESVDVIFGNRGSFHELIYAVIESKWIPAPEFIRGLDDLRSRLMRDSPGYVLGDVRLGGWWYFFPLALAIKTPLAFIILVSIAGVLLVTEAVRTHTYALVAPVAVAVGILVSVLPSKLNIGIRHVLIVYPLLSIAAGYTVVHFFESYSAGLLSRTVCGLLLYWQIGSVAIAHPDYLPYFNELAGNDPGRFLVDSDLDWGQDLDRLALELKRRGADSVAISYFGSADIDKHGLPHTQPLVAKKPISGWIAVSEYMFRVQRENFIWLAHYRPLKWAGRSIRLYYIPRT